MRLFPFRLPVPGFVLCIAGLLLAATPMRAAEGSDATGEKARRENPADKLAWKAGPTKGDLKGRALIEVPKGFRFLDSADAARLLVLSGNRSTGKELGVIENKAEGWWVIFEFDDVGYVKDDEKDKLDADKLLKSIKAGNEQGNEYRKENGQAPISIVGWHVKPNFNDETKNLEWSVLAESRGSKFVNYNVRVLGRNGVTEVTLIDDLESVDKSLPGFREVLKNFSYKSGESYAEFKSGDKIAEYGLAALVLGGAGAVAYKLGFLATIGMFFKKFFKLIIAGVVALAVGIKKLVSFGTGSKRSDG